MDKPTNIKEVKIDYIIEYCTAEGADAIAWLKETSKLKSQCKVYPKVNGKADKTQEPTMEERPISFIEIRNAFVAKYIPELKVEAKAKKPSMYERIAAL